MVLRTLAAIMALGFCSSGLALAQANSEARGSGSEAQDLSRTVFAISELKFDLLKSRVPGLAIGFETGFCVDADCRFVGTTYHGAVEARPRKIKGETVVRRYLATGPEDEDAKGNVSLMGQALRFTPSRDLAVFELRRPLEKHFGITYNLVDLKKGDRVDIYAFPLEASKFSKQFASPRRRLLKVGATFVSETADHTLAFRCDEEGLHPGASGGLVVKDGKVVGVLNGVGTEDRLAAFAVKAQALADFLSKIQPYLHAELFPEDTQISPISADLYPPYAFPPPAGTGKRPVDPVDVVSLRRNAQVVADSIYNFIAVQSFAWGVNNKIPQREAQYEVRMIDGFQRFREYPSGKKLYEEVPLPTLNDVMAPGGEWFELPQMLGTQLNLRIHQAADASVNGRRVKVFQYRADPEDNLCVFKSILDFEFFSVSKTHSVSCFGEVWTDENLNLVRVSEHLDLSGRWKNWQAVVTYGWLEREGEPRRRIPVTIASQAELHGKVYWCRGQFTDYKEFGTRVKLLAGNSSGQSARATVDLNKPPLQ